MANFIEIIMSTNIARFRVEVCGEDSKSNYEDMDDQPQVHLMPVKDKDSTTIGISNDPETNSIEERLKNPFQEDYYNSEDFYTKVFATFDRINKREKTEQDVKDSKITWRECEKRYRLEILKDRYESAGDDPLVALMTKSHDEYKLLIAGGKYQQFDDVFVQALSEFADILLNEDYNGSINNHGDYNILRGIREKQHYNVKSSLLDVVEPYNTGEKVSMKVSKTSILHIAAQRNLCQIAETYLRLYPNSICITDVPSEGRRPRTPVEVALAAENDKMCHLLMTKMLNERVRELFQGKPKSPARYELAALVAKGNMKETVVAVLNSCVNPHLPYMYQPKEREKEEKWSNLPTMPLQYNFYFQILDGDFEARLPIHLNKFNIASPSCFQMITNCADTNDEQDPIKHMVVRQLARKKWLEYGQKTVMMQGGFYVLYLLAMSIALFIGGKREDPTKYVASLDKARGFFEIVTILFTMFYLFTEVSYIIGETIAKTGKEYGNYLPWSTIFHIPKIIYILALLGIIALVPCHLLGLKTPARSIASVAYLVIFIQLFYYFPLCKEYGTYSNTFYQIIKIDIKQFLVVIAVVVMAFSGSIYMAMSASNSFDSDFDNLWTVLLQELRAIFEGKEFADSYAEYHVLLTLLILTSMFFIIIVMGNILIGQISDRYANAKGIAMIQCDIDRAKMVTRNERSCFAILKNKRKKIEEGMYVSNQELISDLIQDLNTYYVSKDDDTKKAVNSLIEKNILKRIK